MVSRAADYEWGSYHDACAGDRGAIAGYDREAEEEGLTPKSVPTLRREWKDALRFSRAAYHKGQTLEVPCGLPRRMRRCG